MIPEYAPIIIFYAIVALVIFLTRKKWTFQSKFIALLKTKVGIHLMNKWGEKAGPLIRGLGTIGIYVGFAGMIFITFIILKGMYELIFVPGAPPTISPVIPGVKIPGTELEVPFWEGIIALFVTIVIHEFAHGVVAAAHKIKVKASGLVWFGPLPGAFVEPDEKQLLKSTQKKQLSVYAAGPFSNVLVALLLIILCGFVPLLAFGMGFYSEGLQEVSDTIAPLNIVKLRGGLYEATGLNITGVIPGSGAEQAGITNGTVINKVNGIPISDQELFEQELIEFTKLHPGDTVEFSNDQTTYTIVAGQHPDNITRGQLGIYFDPFLVTEVSSEAEEKYGAWIPIINYTHQQILWIILLMLGIGLANLLPLGPVDGGRMFLIALEKFFPKKKARKIWSKISLVVLILILILLITPIIRALVT